MTIINCESNGVKLLVQFTCCRCKKVHVEDLAPLVKNVSNSRDGFYGHLHELPKPSGWTDYLIHSRLLCDTCTKALEEFFKGGETDANN